MAWPGWHSENARPPQWEELEPRPLVVQRIPLAKPDIRVGNAFFIGRNDTNSWWNTPRNRLPGNVLNALLSGITGPLVGYAACDSCEDNIQDLFFADCPAFEDDIFHGCANCIWNNTGDNCNLVKPVFVCLEQGCALTKHGHEHFLRGWIQNHFSQTTNMTVDSLLKCKITPGIWLMPPAYSEVTQKIRAGEAIDERMRDALLAASRELTEVKWCGGCMDINKQVFAYCTRTPRTDFHGGACPACIQKGMHCERDGEWEGFSN
ncbi:hypothetical protein V8F33_009033 [Rhypophila sp. PSN 637]